VGWQKPSRLRAFKASSEGSFTNVLNHNNLKREFDEPEPVEFQLWNHHSGVAARNGQFHMRLEF